MHALSDPARVAIFAQIAGASSPKTCSNFVNIAEKSIPKSTLSQHFKALREAGLIRGERQGVEMRNTSRCAEIDKRFPGLIAAIVKAHNIQSAEAERAGNGRKRRPASRKSRNKRSIRREPKSNA